VRPGAVTKYDVAWVTMGRVKASSERSVRGIPCSSSSGIPIGSNEMSTRRDATRRVDHGLEMVAHSLLIDRVDLRRLGGTAGLNHVLGKRLDG
jgi:hypothetical protein